MPYFAGMRRRTPAVLVVALIWGPGPAAASPDPVHAIRTPMPQGPAAVSLACTIEPQTSRGAWLAVFSVDADSTGYTESSVTALGWWDHGSLDVTVRVSGRQWGPPPVTVTRLGERYRVTLAATWGGPHRSWAATLRGGCAGTDAVVSDVTTIVGGARVDDARVDARLVTAGPREFADAVAAQGTTVARGAVAVDAAYLLGVFSARYGTLTAIAPDGVRRSQAGLQPSLPVRSGFGGTWRFEASPAASDDPYLLTALAFDAR